MSTVDFSNLIWNHVTQVFLTVAAFHHSKRIFIGRTLSSKKSVSVTSVIFLLVPNRPMVYNLMFLLEFRLVRQKTSNKTISNYFHLQCLMAFHFINIGHLISVFSFPVRV